MWKRLWKHAILALCVLALVLQPVTVFADDPESVYTYNTVSNWIDAVESYFETTASMIFTGNHIVSSSPSGYPSVSDIITYCNNNNITWAQTAFIYTYTATNKTSKVVYIFQTGSIVGNTASNYTSITANSSYVQSTRLSISNTGTITSSLQNSWTSQYYYQVVSYNSNYTITDVVDGIYINDGFSLKANSNGNVRFVYDTGYVPSGGGSNSGGNGSSADLSTIETYLANLYLQNGLLISNNFRSYTPDGTLVNGSWLGVGAFLTYQYNCMQNMNSASVTYINQSGTTITASNPYYYFYHQLDSIFVDISDIMLAVEDISDNATYISDINDRLELAFPDDQADMNDHIADTLLDDTNGNGLTISKISSTKSNLDDGLDTFKLDTSQSQYNNPFSALGDADWSFWSQTTLNNLGSGYSYSFDDGSLMSEDDVFTENQNDLLNLLGW